MELKTLGAYRDARVDQQVLAAFAEDAKKARALVASLSEKFVEQAGEM